MIYILSFYLENSNVPFFGTGVVVTDVAGTQACYSVKVFLFQNEVLEVLLDTGRRDALGDD